MLYSYTTFSSTLETNCKCRHSCSLDLTRNFPEVDHARRVKKVKELATNPALENQARHVLLYSPTADSFSESFAL